MTATRARRLAPDALAMLDSLYLHRLLTTRQLHDLHTPDASIRWTQRLLVQLRDAGLATAALQPRGGHGVWHVTSAGADAVETVPDRVEIRRKVLTPEQAGGVLQAHTLAVNDVGLAFVRAARERGDECGPSAWRHEIAHPLRQPTSHRRAEQLVADAVLTYQHVQPEQITFAYAFVELDRATMPVDALAAKLARYAQLHEHSRAVDGDGEAVPLWTERYCVFPTVLVVLAGSTPDRLRRRRRTLMALCGEAAALRSTPEVEIAISLLADLSSHGPFAVAPVLRAPR
jgi:Replication-relaxation